MSLLSRRVFTKVATRPFFSTSARLLYSRVQAVPPRIRTTLSIAALLAGSTLFLVYYFDSRSAIHQYVIPPLLRATLDAETSHKIAVKILKNGLGPKDTIVDDERLAVELWGERLPNPIGLAAGFDKDGEAIDGIFDLGFGWVEIGSVTPMPQPGNPRPRVFYLPSEEALINRYGFPSKGHTFLVSRLRARLTSSASTSHNSSRLLSVNLGKNKSSPVNSISDFLCGIHTFAPYAPVLVINVSSPNTPGLRALQGRDMLEELLKNTVKERDVVAETLGRRPRLVLKIAPDLTEDGIRDLAEVVRTSGVDGVIVSNTTVARPEGLVSPHKNEQGGLSGRPLKPLALRTLSTLRTLLPASIPIIGCGGISSGADVLEFARAGASAVQLYTVLGYDGAGTVRRIKDELTEELQKLGMTWAQVSREAVERRARKAPDTASMAGIDSLIREAERLKCMLDDLTEKFVQEVKSMPATPESIAENDLERSEEDSRGMSVGALPPVPADLS